MKNMGYYLKMLNLKKLGSIIKSILKVYEIYQNKTKDLNAFDFGDLIYLRKIIRGSQRH